jgi:CRISP-associated protein Cas1
VLGLVNRKAIGPEDFIYRKGAPAEFVDEEEMAAKRPVEMKPAVNRAFISAYEEMMRRSILYPPLGRRLTYRGLILQQVCAFGQFLTEPGSEYRPFVWEG